MLEEAPKEAVLREAQMSEAAFTFHILGRTCVVILPPSLDVPPANDVLGAGIDRAQRGQGREAEGHASAATPPRPSEVVLRGPTA